MAIKKYKFIKGKKAGSIVPMYEEQAKEWLNRGLVELVNETTETTENTEPKEVTETKKTKKKKSKK